jgi:hypothetical protein
MEIKVDITSGAVEKSIDLAKSFVSKLITPTVEETGLLIKSKATEWRFNREIKILNKAMEICRVNNINPKTINLKLLCPLLEFSGLEEDEELHDKWAVLLSNMVDSEQNIANHVFPYILSQLSKNEFISLEQVYDDKMANIRKLSNERDKYKEDMPELKKPIQHKLNEINISIEKYDNAGGNRHDHERWELTYDKAKLESELSTIEHKYLMFSFHMRNLAIVPDDTLENFELSNVIRLGLVKVEKDFFANTQSIEIPTGEYDRSYVNVDFDIDVESDITYFMTELGELFFNACKEKRFKNIS